MADNDTKLCPFCGEEIKEKAKKCRFCHSMLDKEKIEEVESLKKRADVAAHSIDIQKSDVKKCRECGLEHTMTGYYCKECDYKRFNEPITVDRYDNSKNLPHSIKQRVGEKDNEESNLPFIQKHDVINKSDSSDDYILNWVEKKYDDEVSDDAHILNWAEGNYTGVTSLDKQNAKTKYKKCSFCDEEILVSSNKCKHCKSLTNNSIVMQDMHPKSSKGDWTNKNQNFNYIIVEGLKTTNTPLLWISLDYWNLYIFKNKVVIARCHRGWWGLIGFIIGLFLYIVTFFILSGIGILLDKSQGESKCRLMKNRIDEILASKEKYKVIEVSFDQVHGLKNSDLCLGNIWLKYAIDIAGKSYYFEESKYAEVENALQLIRGD